MPCLKLSLFCISIHEAYYEKTAALKKSYLNVIKTRLILIVPYVLGTTIFYFNA